MKTIFVIMALVLSSQASAMEICTLVGSIDIVTSPPNYIRDESGKVVMAVATRLKDETFIGNARVFIEQKESTGITGKDYILEISAIGEAIPAELKKAIEKEIEYNKQFHLSERDIQLNCRRQ